MFAYWLHSLRRKMGLAESMPRRQRRSRMKGRSPIVFERLEDRTVPTAVVPTLSGVALTPVLDLGNQATLTGAISGPANEPFTLDVNWGDGTATQTYNLPAGTTAFSESHTYASTGNYTVSAAVGDGDFSNDLLYASTGGASPNPGQLVVLDLTNQTTTVIGSLPGDNVTEIVNNPALGQSWLQYGNNEYDGEQFNIATGAAVGSTIADAPQENFNAMTYIGGTLYATGTPATGGTSPSSLYALNPTTGTATLIGATGVNGPISGIAYDAANGTLYGIEGGTASTLNFVSINQTTGAATTLFSTPSGVKFGSLSYAPDGDLYAGSSTGEIYLVNPTTHAVTLILATGYTGAISGLTLGDDTASVQTTVDPALSLTPSTLPADTVNIAYNQSIGFTGGAGSATLSVGPVTNAINGLTIGGSGTGSISITGTPTASGTESFTVTATDSLGAATTTNYSVTVNPALALSPASLPADTMNVGYNQSITEAGGTGVVTLAVSNIANAIPGLTIAGSGTDSITITGTPTAAGTETFTVTATDGVGATTSINYTITVNPAITLTITSLPATTIGVSYDQSIDSAGGTGTVNLSVTNVQNAIPGLTIPGAGVGSLEITGTASAVGTETFTVTASDALGDSVSAEYSITVNQAITVTPVSLPADTVGVPYSQAFTTDGMTNAFYANQVISYNPGTLADPSYDNPDAALGGLNPVVGNFGGSNYYLTPFDPAYSSSDLVEIGAGGSLVLKLAQTASTDGYTIGVHTGIGLIDADYPNGVNTDPASYFNSWLRAADVLVSADGINWGDLGTITFDNPSNVDSGAATDPEGGSPGVGPAANVGQPFLGSLRSFNGETWQQTLATLNGSAGGTWLNLSGVTDENGNPITGVNYIEFVVPQNPSIDPNTGNPELMMVDAVVGTNTTAAISANGGTGNVTLAVSNLQNAIPGLTVQTTGVGGLAISGTPTASGTEFFTVTATDAGGASINTTYSITVNPAVALSPATLPGGAFGAPYNQTITANGGTGAVTLTVTDIQDAIPGLSIPASGTGTLAITGTPTVAGTETFLVTATDSVGGASGPMAYSIAVTPAGTLTLSPVTLKPGAVASSYGPIDFSANGGFGSYTFSLAKGNALPSGLTLSTAGVMSGTPTAAGTFGFTITAKDNSDPTLTGQLRYSMLVTPALSASPTALAVATVGDPFSTQLKATGGAGGGYVFSATGLPAGLSLSSTGLLSGIPTTSGTPFHAVVTVTDSNSMSHNFNYALTVDPAVTLGPSALPVATIGNHFAVQLHAGGGSGQGYVFSAAALPSWLALSSTGLLSGTPTATAVASSSFTVTVTDGAKGTTSTVYLLTVDPALVISPTTLSVVTVGNPFSTQLTAAGGAGTGYVFTGVDLPTWMSLSSSGLLKGTPPSAAGSLVHFSVIARDSAGGTISQAYSLGVNPAPAISPVTLPFATVGDAFNVQLHPYGGSGQGYVFTSADVPAWLNLSSSGFLSGMPTSTTGSPFYFIITLTDSNSVSRTFDYAVTVDPALGLNSNSLPIATVGDAFHAQLSAIGGSGHGYVYRGVNLPSWLKVSNAGALTGTPPASALSTASFVIDVADSAGGTASAVLTLNVDPALVLSPTTLTVVTVGNPFTTQLTAAGGSGSGYTFTGAGLPGWMSVSSTGLLSGMPTTAAGSPIHFTITATDSEGGSVSHVYSLSINPALAVGPAALPVATVGDLFNLELSAAGGSGMGYVFAASGLPGWLTLSSTGLLNGTPTAPADGSPLDFTVTLTDSNGVSRTFNEALTVDSALALNPGSLPIATVGDSFHAVLSATGGSGGGYVFSAAGLPAGLTLSKSGVLSGTPTTATGTPSLVGTPFTFTVKAVDSKGGSISQAYSLTVDSALVIQPTSLPTATVGTAMNVQLSASGGSGAGYSFSAVGLPAGLTLSSTGLLSGTPTTATGSAAHVTVALTDGNGGSTTRVFSLTVDAALAIHPASLPSATVAHAYRTQLTATGGTGAGYVFSSPNLPAWLQLSATGLLSGTPPAGSSGGVSLIITLKDSSGDTTSNTYGLTIAP